MKYIELNGVASALPTGERSWTWTKKVGCNGIRAAEVTALVQIGEKTYSGHVTKGLGCGCVQHSKPCGDKTWDLVDNDLDGNVIGAVTIQSKEERTGSTVTMAFAFTSLVLEKVLVDGQPYTPVAGKITVAGPIPCEGYQALMFPIELRFTSGLIVYESAAKDVGCACPGDHSKLCGDAVDNLYDPTNLNVLEGTITVHSTKEGKEGTEYQVLVQAAPEKALALVTVNGVAYTPAILQQFVTVVSVPCDGFRDEFVQVAVLFTDDSLFLRAVKKGVGCRCVEPKWDCKSTTEELLDLVDPAVVRGTATITTQESLSGTDMKVVFESATNMVGISINGLYYQVSPTKRHSITLDQEPCAGMQLKFMSLGVWYEDFGVAASNDYRDIGCKCASTANPQCSPVIRSVWQWDPSPSVLLGTVTVEETAAGAVTMKIDMQQARKIIAVVVNGAEFAGDNKNSVLLTVQTQVQCPMALQNYYVAIQLADFSWATVGVDKWVGCSCA